MWLLTTATARADGASLLPSHRAEALVSAFAPAERTRGVRTIAETMPRAEAAEWLARLLTLEVDESVRAEILRRLGFVADTSSLASFSRFVASDRAIERRLAFLGLAVLGTSEALDVMVSGLLSEGTRPDALAALRRLDVVPTLRLLRALSETNDARLAEGYVVALGVLRDPRATGPLETLGLGAEEPLRGAVTLALSRIRGEAVAPPSTLLSVESSPAPCFVSSPEAPSEAFAYARMRLRHGVPRERAEAALVLAADPRAQAELEAALDDDSVAVRAAVAFALSRNESSSSARARLRSRAAMETDDLVAMLLMDAASRREAANRSVTSVSMLESCFGDEGGNSAMLEGENP